MKRIVLLSALLLLGLKVMLAQTEITTSEVVDTAKLPVMIFEITEYDFGTLKKGDPCIYDFVFKNDGKSDLVITNVRSSCGCTTPTYTQEPVKKNDKGTISVKYDSNRVGSFSKTITITSNAKNSPVIISIKGKIEDVPVENTGEQN